VLFQGVIELYNRSSRANAIHTYEFWAQGPGGEWHKLESEHYTNKDEAEDSVFNRTPLGLAPYSGAEARVQAIMKRPHRPEVDIRIEVEDIFEKRYRVQVKATP
jgi:hypothetical protein